MSLILHRSYTDFVEGIARGEPHAGRRDPATNELSRQMASRGLSASPSGPRLGESCLHHGPQGAVDQLDTHAQRVGVVAVQRRPRADVSV